jgi:hypothetical protein
LLPKFLHERFHFFHYFRQCFLIKGEMKTGIFIGDNLLAIAKSIGIHLSIVWFEKRTHLHRDTKFRESCNVGALWDFYSAPIAGKKCKPKRKEQPER